VATNWDAHRAKINMAFKEDGAKITVNHKQIGETYDVVSGQSTKTTVSYTVYGFIRNFDNLIDEVVPGSEFLVIVSALPSADFERMRELTVQFGNEEVEYKVVKVSPVKPAAVTLMYKLYCAG